MLKSPISALAATVLLATTPAFAKKGVKTGADARILIYDAEHPTAPPEVLLTPVDEARTPNAPMLLVKLGKEPEDTKTTEKSVILDQFKFKRKDHKRSSTVPDGTGG